MITRGRLMVFLAVAVTAVILVLVYTSNDGSQSKTKFIPTYDDKYRAKPATSQLGGLPLTKGKEIQIVETDNVGDLHYDDVQGDRANENSNESDTDDQNTALDKLSELVTKDENTELLQQQREELQAQKLEIRQQQQQLEEQTRMLQEQRDQLARTQADLQAQRLRQENEDRLLDAKKSALENRQEKLDEQASRLQADKETFESKAKRRRRKKHRQDDIEEEDDEPEDDEEQMQPQAQVGPIEVTKPWGELGAAEIERRYPDLIPSSTYKYHTLYDPSDPGAFGQENANSLDDMDSAALENRYYQLVTTDHLQCRNTVRLGNIGDGGWDVCIAEPYSLKPGCIVYSFGINNDFSFDDDASGRYGCEVRAFDPSMGVGDHMHSYKVYFYNLGIGEYNEVNTHGWKIENLKTIFEKLGHANTVIDYLKIDIEYNEWASFRAMLRDGVLNNVKQFGFEIHTPEVVGVERPSERADFIQMYDELLALEKQGFRKYHNHFNPYGRYISRRTHKERTCCYEMYYINLRFLNDGASNS